MNTSNVRTTLIAIAVTGTVAVASNVTLPHTFQPNTPARAGEVNASFAAVKAAVDDNQRQISELRDRMAGASCAASSVLSSDTCIEKTYRPAALDWLSASKTCASLNGFLCPAAKLLAACATNKISLAPAASGAEWTEDMIFWQDLAGNRVYWGGLVAGISALSPCATMMPSPFSTESLMKESQNYYRCCFRP